MGDKVDFSVVGPTGLGLHITINPQKKPKITTDTGGRADIPDNDISVREIYMQHGLTLGDKELRALKLSRPQGTMRSTRCCSTCRALPTSSGTSA